MKESNGLKIGILAVAIIAAGVLGVLVFNGEDSATVTTNSQTDASDQAQAVQQKEIPLNLSLTNLEPLTEGVYEGWIVRGDDKFSFGTFNTDSSGAIVGNLDLGDVVAQEGDRVVITIEPTEDTDSEPSGIVILSGDIVGGSAELTFPIDVSAFSGQYILGTPTTTITSDETAGVWFTSTGSDALLDLPDAPDGWTYEGWVVFEGNALSTGKFKTVSERDSFEGYSGTDKRGPGLPGEDFILNLPNGVNTPVDLANGSTKVVVSIEPDVDGVDPTGAGPAQVKPLVGDVPAGAQDHTKYGLNLSTDSLPSGSAQI